MSTIALIVLGFGIICYIEIPQLIERKYWKELAIFSAFLLLAFVLIVMHSIGIKLPNPNEPAEILLNFNSR